ncbi:hypothetical protein [Paenibacillus sp. GCM10023250]|uniref:hypothetical protein n=1 Tax=Paenibacillus sp. GCM10023250 TaxID=3252648 RepID=UPI003621E14D
MTILFILVGIVMAAGVAATIMIGESKSNKQENPDYFRNTGRKWMSLTGIYAIGLAVAAICLIIFIDR